MTNLDMKKTLKYLYQPSAKEVSIVDVPAMNYLMIDGEGNPNTSEQYQQAVESLYNLAYAIRAVSKDAGQVYTVMPLEGLWTIQGQDAPPENFKITNDDKDRFVWTLIILQPEHITMAMAEQARENINKKKDSPALLSNVRFEAYHEGEVVQLMHIGSYDEEGPTVARLHHHIEVNGWTLRGKHHEIYLSDPRKVAPEKLKTVIRQPFTR
jgi:hypothetical protein